MDENTMIDPVKYAWISLNKTSFPALRLGQPAGNPQEKPYKEMFKNWSLLSN